MVGNITYQQYIPTQYICVVMTSRTHPNAQRYKMYSLTVHSGVKFGKKVPFRKATRSAHHFDSKSLKGPQPMQQLLRINCTFLQILDHCVCISPILFCILFCIVFFRTEWRSELDRPRKWRIRVTQIPCDCKDNEDPGMELAPAGNLWILWAVLYVVYSTGCPIWIG